MVHTIKGGTNDMNDILIRYQASLYASHNVRTDVYYIEGKGALFVPEGAALIPPNVILAIPDGFLR
jgi:hypothetical protein